MHGHSYSSIYTFNYLPPCSKCGHLMNLARIEPALEPGHDLRTFECPTCGSSDEVVIRYRDGG